MGDEGEKITVKLGKKKPAKPLNDVDDEVVAPLLPGTTFSVDDAKNANLAELKPSADKAKADTDEASKLGIKKVDESSIGPEKDVDTKSDDKKSETDDQGNNSESSEFLNEPDQEPSVDDKENQNSDSSEQTPIDDSENELHNESGAELSEAEDQDLLPEPVQPKDQEDKDAQTKPLEEDTPEHESKVEDNTASSDATKDAPVIASPKPKKSHKKLIIGTLVSLLAILIISGVGVYLYVIQPRQALAAYVAKFTDETKRPKSFSYDIASQVKDSSNRYGLNFTGSWDATSQVKSLLSMDINGKYNSTDQTNNINVETVTEKRDGKSKTYINIHQPNFIETIFPGSLNQWLELDESVSKFGVSGCSQSTDKLDIAAGNKLSMLAVQDVQRVGLMPQAVNGYKANQFRGKIEGKDLLATVKEILAEYNKTCKTSIGLAASEEQSLRSTTINYDIWLGEAFDKLSVVVNQPDNQEFSFSITTKDYDTSRNISVPKDTKTLESVISDFNFDETSFDDYLDTEQADEVNIDDTQVKTLAN